MLLIVYLGYARQRVVYRTQAACLGYPFEILQDATISLFLCRPYILYNLPPNDDPPRFKIPVVFLSGQRRDKHIRL